jgi:uncharacterized protein YdeI (YjbR/CyaY-like superfamily)
METLNGAEIITCDNAAQWESWLAEHHELPAGVWLKVAKKGSGLPSVTIKEALEVALCYGWIDSQRKGLDETHYLQKYSRRRPKGSWSRVNVELAEALIAAGRMRAPGFAEIAAAQADGRWDAAYESQRTAEIPADLAAALEADQRAREFFQKLGRTDQYAVILRLMKAQTPQRRVDQLQKMITLLAAGQKVN